MRLVLVRHGETEWNLQGRYQGRADTELSARGVRTARRAAARLASRHFGLIVASPLRRAAATAAVIAATLGGLPTLFDERLAEIDFGEWQGLTQSEVKSQWPEMLRCWKRAPETFRFPDGESLAEALERLRGFVRHPPWRQDEGDVLAVSHAGAIRLAVLSAEGRPLSQFRDFAVDAGAIHEFEWRAGGDLCRVNAG